MIETVKSLSDILQYQLPAAQCVRPPRRLPAIATVDEHPSLPSESHWSSDEPSFPRQTASSNKMDKSKELEKKLKFGLAFGILLCPVWLATWVIASTRGKTTRAKVTMMMHLVNSTWLINQISSSIVEQ